MSAVFLLRTVLDAFAAARRRLRAFPRERGAVAAIEFAFAMPMLMVFMLGGSEVARYVNATRQLTNLANSYATLLAVRTTNLTYNDAVFTYNSGVVTFPSVLKDAKARNMIWQMDMQVTLSSIQMSKTNSWCLINCSYSAKVVWSLNSPTAGARSCNTAPRSVPNTDPPSLATLPRDVFNPGSIVVADIVYTYTPAFAAAYLPTFTIRRSAYLAPRYLSTLRYTNYGSGDPYRECT